MPEHKTCKFFLPPPLLSRETPFPTYEGKEAIPSYDGVFSFRWKRGWPILPLFPSPFTDGEVDGGEIVVSAPPPGDQLYYRGDCVLPFFTRDVKKFRRDVVPPLADERGNGERGHSLSLSNGRIRRSEACVCWTVDFPFLFPPSM